MIGESICFICLVQAFPRHHSEARTQVYMLLLLYRDRGHRHALSLVLDSGTYRSILRLMYNPNRKEHNMVFPTFL